MASDDCLSLASSHYLRITTTHPAEDEDPLLHTLLFEEDTPTTTAATAALAPPSTATSRAVIDLDLLLTRDSIDGFHDHQQQQQQSLSRLNASQQYHGGPTLSALSSFPPSRMGRPWSELIRPEVTAVQAFLDEWQHDDDDENVDANAVQLVISSAGSSRGDDRRKAAILTTSPPAVAKRHPGKPKWIGTHEREKEEAIQLRKEALQLEFQLEQLRRSVQLAVSGSDNAGSAGTPLWKSLAERQRERIHLAEMENTSLRIAVRDQKRMAKSLHRILLNRVVQVADMRPRFKVLMPWHELGESPDDQEVFERLMASASTMYAQTDRVSQALRAKTPPSGSYRKFDVKHQSGASSHDSSNKVYIELIDVEELPFSVSQVNFFIQSLSSRIKTSTVRNGDKTVPVTILMGKEQHGRANSSRQLRMRNVFLNFVEPSRSIFIYCSLLDAVGPDGRPVPGRILQERKWIIVTNKATLDGISSSSSSSSKRGGDAPAGPHKTVVQTYSTIAPMDGHPLAQDATWNREDILKSEIPMWDMGYSLLSQKMENDLLKMVTTK